MTKLRVTNNIDEGYDFEVQHSNWSIDLTWKERCLLFLYYFVPTIVINLAYMIFKDILLSQMLYQLSLVFLPLIYQQMFPLNLDVLYIQYVRNIPVQIKQGICWMVFYLIFIPLVPIVLNMVHYEIFEDMVLFIPSGLTPDSLFQNIVHLIYFMLIFVIYGIIAPIAEFRYYLVFLQSKFGDSAFTYIVLWFILLLNNLSILLLYLTKVKLRFVLVFVGAVVLNTFLILRNKANNGIIVTLLRQFGINIGFITVMVLSVYSGFIINQRDDISLYINKNGIDMVCDGFIWDDPNYNSSF